MSIVVNDLHRLIGQLAPHICTDDTLPPLTGIHLQVTGGRLTAAATDRHTIAIATRETEETDEPSDWTALLDRADLHALRTLFPARTAGQGLRLTYRPPTAEDPDGRLLFTLHGRTLTLSANAGRAARFPKLRPIVSTALEAEPRLTSPACFNADYLARWRKAADRYTPITVWSAGPEAPLVVAIGPDFLGLQMPVRIDLRADGGACFANRDSVRADWAHLLGTTPDTALPTAA
ncbi:hypothetical protein ACFV4P_34365 [Kitasatospora sp. NPDC059795]|uniref:DNA polymerase III subunit beta family protein n=1 Tax=Kitasatospora sp. NPDC059795 TaxID=3346949 RepID=UPI00364CC810